MNKRILTKHFLLYRDALKRNYNLRQYYLEVNLEDLASYDESLADKVYKQPSEHVPIFEEAARDVADEITSPRPEGEEQVNIDFSLIELQFLFLKSKS